jgi:pimeloyl-ACP methyl ester carboxylesterase
VSHRFPTPSRAYHAIRDQLGSIRGVYLAGNRIVRREDFRSRELVLLLHGFFQTRNIWEVMEDRLRYDGYGVISFNLGGLLYRFNTHPIDTLASLIAEKIEGLIRRHGFASLHIIGHSKGGLIARDYIQHHGGDKRAKSLITLGTPHHGTPTAVVAVGLMGMGLVPSSAGDLLPNSRLVKAINRDTFPAHVPLTSIYSREDLVCPYWCSVLRPRPGETSMHNVQVRGVGHSQLAWDPGVYRVVQKHLEESSALWNERHPAPPDGQGLSHLERRAG